MRVETTWTLFIQWVTLAKFCLADSESHHAAFPNCKPGEHESYRNRLQCDAYYECINGELFPKECPKRFQYKSAEKACVESPKGQCHRTGLIFGCPLLWRGLGNKCYAISETLSSFEDQVEACKSTGGSKLAEIRSAQELKYIGMWLNDTYGIYFTEFYINIKFDQKSMQWLYGTDGVRVDSDLFSPKDFQSYYALCAAVTRDAGYTLKSFDCSEPMNALCEQDPNY